MLKLSIIIPVYNVGLLLSRCLDSCLDQDLSYSEYEIIAINDGSTDNSLDILNEYALKYPNIRFFSQENRGLSVTRNEGLKYAKGEYVWFVDSDDCIEKRVLRKLYNYCINDRLDVLAFGRRMETYPVYRDNLLRVVYSGSDFLFHLNNVVSVPQYMWNTSFLKKNNLNFFPEILHEDMDFTPRALFFCTKIRYVDEVPYIVFPRENSITHTINLKRCTDLILVSNNLNDFKKKYILDDESVKSFNKIISACVSSSIRMLGKLNSADRILFISLLRSNRCLFYSLYNRKGYIHKIEALLFGLDPLLYYYIDKIVHI